MYSCYVVWINKYGSYVEYETKSYKYEKTAYDACIKYLKSNRVSFGTIHFCENGKKYDECIICL